MPTSIDFNEIPIFTFFGPDARKALAAAFRPQVRAIGERILTYGGPVPGIFIIVEGEVDVRLPSVTTPVAHLSRGQCFGEMSLLDTLTLDASADVVVASESVKLFFCSIDDFGTILKTVDESSAAFYRGAALQLSSRLRLLNARIDHELNLGETMLSQIVQDSKVNEHLAKTKSEIEETGQHVVEKLITIMPLLDRIRKDHPNTEATVKELQEKIEAVFLGDAQNFDRISQQLAQIQQHFDNLRRVAVGAAAKPIVGDKAIFGGKAQ